MEEDDKKRFIQDDIKKIFARIYKKGNRMSHNNGTNAYLSMDKYHYRYHTKVMNFSALLKQGQKGYDIK